jgi:hypothetical protein
LSNGSTTIRLELRYGGHIRQIRRVVVQVVLRDQRVRLAAAVGQRQLPHGLVALSRQPVSHVPRQRADAARWERQGEELLRVAIHRLRRAHLHVVKIGGEHRQRQFARFYVFAQLDDLVPGFDSVAHRLLNASSQLKI